MALRNLGADFEHYKVVEFDKYAIASYNAIHGTSFETMDITKVKGEDLKIVDTDSFTYLLTYSFPCTDLSVAGKMKGMSKNSGTRSGLLWEVERLLNEVEELPQVLLMENVPQVVGKANIDDFHLWQNFLEDKGYSNYTENLNAKNYGVAQNRNRTFMVSILGEWNYNFPKQIPLTKTMKDYLEDEVDEKYYIKSEKAQKLIDELISSGKIARQTDNVLTEQSITQIQEKSQTVSRQDMTQESATYVQTETWLLKNMSSVDRKSEVVKQIDVACTLCARDYKGFGNQAMNGVIEVVENVIIGGMQKNQSVKTDGVCTTLTSSMGEGGGYVPMVVASRGRNKENSSDRTPGAEFEQRLEPNSEGICNTLTSVQKDNLVLEPSILTPKRTEYGKAIRKDYENGKIQESRHNMTELQPREDGISNTLTTVQKDNLVLEPNKTYLENAIEQIIEKNNGEIPEVWDLYNKNPINNGISKALSTDCGHTGTAGATAVTQNYRIRKLTPRECWKLMAFTDEDFHKAEEVNSNTQLYRQAGNSIVVSVLEAIFKQML